mmetsp:Transcript_19590/g.44140  ORF Transcript_19590/g.44140 Transcript_19590/m.44140 type:complete len:110 (-) Transcript_19590:366-695(-)
MLVATGLLSLSLSLSGLTDCRVVALTIVNQQLVGRSSGATKESMNTEWLMRYQQSLHKQLVSQSVNPRSESSQVSILVLNRSVNNSFSKHETKHKQQGNESKKSIHSYC